MKQVAVYRDIIIIESYGYYSPLIDLSIEEHQFSKIIEWIDNFLNIEVIPTIVDTFIIGEYVLCSKYNLN